MGKKKQRLPDYLTVIGEGAEVGGGLRFTGGVHIDGQVTGDVRGQTEDGCALTLGRTGVIKGNLDVAYVVLDGTVIGDVRASRRAALAPGARIEGALYYGVLEMAEGAQVSGKLLQLDEGRASQSESPQEAGGRAGAGLDLPDSEAKARSEEGASPEQAGMNREGNT